MCAWVVRDPASRNCVAYESCSTRYPASCQLGERLVKTAGVDLSSATAAELQPMLEVTAYPHPRHSPSTPHPSPLTFTTHLHHSPSPLTTHPSLLTTHPHHSPSPLTFTPHLVHHSPSPLTLTTHPHHSPSPLTTHHSPSPLTFTTHPQRLFVLYHPQHRSFPDHHCTSHNHKSLTISIIIVHVR